MRIFVLSGQSNMAGRGGVHHRHWDGVVPPECAPDLSILRLSSALAWEEAREPLHADIDAAKTCGVGPGMAFARAVLPRLKPPGAGIGLVPCAVGGTAIREWARGEHLYDQMVRRARSAAECGEIQAVLWYQGESDAESYADAAAYQGNVERLIADVRADLGIPPLPFIQVALASGNKNNIEKVRKAQLSVNLPNVVTVDAIGLALNEDNLHLTTRSQVSEPIFYDEEENDEGGERQASTTRTSAEEPPAASTHVAGALTPTVSESAAPMLPPLLLR